MELLVEALEKRQRILFVGDSWTGDPNTADDEAYFGVVGRNLPVEVFAIGGGGLTVTVKNLVEPASITAATRRRSKWPTVGRTVRRCA